MLWRQQNNRPPRTQRVPNMASRGTRPKIGSPNYRTIGDKNLLNKKVPVNPQYAGVQAKTQTGARWRDDVTFTRPKRKNEFFGRVTADLLVQILDENEEEEESLYNLASSGAAGRSVTYDAGATGANMGGLPYLLLDMREASYYEDFHIKSAASFPASMLSRSTNAFTPLMMQYINHPTNIIVIYCEDEKEGIRCGNSPSFSLPFLVAVVFSALPCGSNALTEDRCIQGRGEPGREERRERLPAVRRAAALRGQVLELHQRRCAGRLR
eukprot:SAG22_NODE_4678_length_1194_cov_1.417352_1_plen_267_part_10